jgi:hypothetical protein
LFITHSPICKNTNYSEIRGGRSELTPQDLHAQGALIVTAATKSVRGFNLAFLFAQYAHGKPKAVAIGKMARRFTDLHESRTILVEILKRHFSKGANMRSQADIAEHFGIKQQRISEIERAINARLFRTAGVVSEALHREFIARGLIYAQ